MNRLSKFVRVSAFIFGIFAVGVTTGAVTAVYNTTIRIVDSAGNVINGTASATTASYNMTARVVDSNGKVIDSFGSTAWSGPYIGGIEYDSAAQSTSKTLAIPSAVASPDVVALYVTVASTGTATPCAVASPGAWTQRGTARSPGVSNFQFLCTENYVSGTTVTVTDASNVVAMKTVDIKKAGGAPTFDQVGSVAQTGGGTCDVAAGGLITPTQNNNLTIIMKESNQFNGGSFITANTPIGQNQSIANPPNMSLVLADNASQETNIQYPFLWAFNQTTAAALPNFATCVQTGNTNSGVYAFDLY